MILKKTIPLWAAVFLLLMSSACESPGGPPIVKVGSGPSFSFRGGGRLIMFAVYAPPAGQMIASPFNIMWMVPDSETAPAIWQLNTAT